MEAARFRFAPDRFTQRRDHLFRSESSLWKLISQSIIERKLRLTTFASAGNVSSKAQPSRHARQVIAEEEQEEVGHLLHPRVDDRVALGAALLAHHPCELLHQRERRLRLGRQED